MCGFICGLWVVAREINRLSALAVSKMSKKGLYADGGGLYLQIGQGGTKSWIFRYRYGLTATGKPRIREMGLGSCNTFTLAEARQKALDCRKLLHDRIDPIEHRKAERAARQVEARKSKTFRECAEAYLSAHGAKWKNLKHAQQWANTLETYAYPEIGNLPVQSVDVEKVLNVLRPIWTEKPETASRVRGRIEAIVDFAKVEKNFYGDNPARWRGHLDKTLPPRAKVQKVKHHAALPFAEIGEFMEELGKQDGVAAKGLAFMILTAARTGETIGATWDEIDTDNRVWTVPADRMKADREHRVPLSTAAIEIIKELKACSKSSFIFPGGRQNRPLSNMAFLQLLKRLERGDLTGHGFRSTFRDWAAECTSFPGEVVEMALAHTVSNKVEAAYRRGDLFEKRRKLMEAWADYCSKSDAGAGTVARLVAG